MGLELLLRRGRVPNKGLIALLRSCRSRAYSTYSSPFLDQVEQSVDRVLADHEATKKVWDLPVEAREALGIARHLRVRLDALARNDVCRRCWLQRNNCICSQIPPFSTTKIATTESSLLPHRLFLLTHHKEICLTVDTAKLLLAAFPDKCRLVVGGIGPQHQDSMEELLDALQSERTLVLFPGEDAHTYKALDWNRNTKDEKEEEEKSRWDLVVIDGTWTQARKLHSRYIPKTPCRHVQLSNRAIAQLEKESSKQEGRISGHQLRRHPIKWKEISTLEATRQLLQDVQGTHPTRDAPWVKTLAKYQQLADAAAKAQLGTKHNQSVHSSS